MKKNLIILVTAIILVLAGCGSKPTLAEYLKSDEMTEGMEATNKQLESAGMSIAITADGEDVLVYTYTCDKDVYGEAFANLTESDFAEAFEPQVTAQKAMVDQLFTVMKDELDIELKAIRFEFVMDGKVLYSTDVTK